MTDRVVISRKVPAAIREMLGPPPLVLAEFESLYYRLIASFAEFVKPADLIAWMLIKDLADARVEIARYRAFKSELINQARRDEIETEVDNWKQSLEEDPGRIRQEAEKQKQALACSVKDPAKLEKLKNQIDRKAASDAREAEAKARRQVRMWQQDESTECDLAVLLSVWIEDVNQIDELLIGAEQRFTDARQELERHLKGLARWVFEDVVDGEIVETRAQDKTRVLAPGGSAKEAPKPSTAQPSPDDIQSAA